MPEALDEARALRWLAAVPRRRSRRSYTHDAISPGVLDALETVAAAFRPWPDARVGVLRETSARVFLGVVGAYGGISGARSALVMIGRRDAPPESVGYTGEGVVLEAATLGVDTCWVGGLFSASHAALVGLEPGERVFAISPLGHAPAASTLKERALFGAARAKWRRSLDEIAPGHDAWPAWTRPALDAVRIAPSATNRQPWRFSFDGWSLTVSYAGADTPRVSKRLDCGIAMLHAELGARGAGVRGAWEALDSPGVARFTPLEG